MRAPVARPAAGEKAGFTLIEVLIALVVLAVVLLPVMLGFTQALTTTSGSSVTAAAANIARDKMEELKGTDFTLLADQPRATRDFAPGDGYFEVAVTVSDEPGYTALKRAVVSVYRTGTPDPMMTVSSYFTPHGI